MLRPQHQPIWQAVYEKGQTPGTAQPRMVMQQQQQQTLPSLLFQQMRQQL
jgi:hypothetical protein